MKGDFSRSTFNPNKHYRGVRMQQGRVQLDADWNENLDILLHRIETESIDVIGECGVPVHDAAFGVVSNFSDLSPDDQAWLTALGEASLTPGDFFLTGGRAYVDGILLELEHALPFSQQPFVLPKGGGKLPAAGIYLLYLDVWNRHITALEDPDIREVALGGPDTTTRMQVVWQAALGKVGNVGDTFTCADDLNPWPDASTGKLQARTTPVPPPDDPCTVPPGSGYTRLENQLYRVEIHKGSDMTGGPTYKWSRDNGSVLVAVTEFPVDGSNAKVRTASLGRDGVLGLAENDWVEVLDDAAELAGLPGTLAKITLIEAGNILTLSQNLSGFSVNDADGNPTHLKVRRWDLNQTQTQAEVTLTEGSYLPLEGGVEIQFTAGGTYRTGDYWMIPARTVPGQYGDIEWPQAGSDPAALLAFGIEHHYCKLALLTADLSKSGALSITNVEDCRKKFPPLTELPAGGNCCCTVSVGQGGDYPDIQSALNARPVDAKVWNICVMAGIYQLADTVTGDSATSLTISGCGQQTQILGPQDKPAFSFTGADTIQLESLWIRASSADGAILFTESVGIVVANCTVINQLSRGTKGNPAVGMTDTIYAKIDFYGGNPGPGIVVIKGSDVEIHDNAVSGLPAIEAEGRKIFIRQNRLTAGGIQIVPPSGTVEIQDNMIIKGTGPGIQLGGDRNDASAFVGYTEAVPGATYKNYLAGIKIATISGNLIGGMDGSGIVTELNLANPNALGDVEDLTIRDNQIIACASQPDILLGNSQVGGGIALIGVFDALLESNFIAENGQGGSPACGIFLLDGSDIEINDNTIVENGIEKLDTDPVAYQAGIAAQFIYGNYLGIGKLEAGELGYPAMRVLGNRVICPAGQALTIAAIGSLVIEGNTLATRERMKQPSKPLDFGERAGCVCVMDLGLPIWFPDIAVLLTAMASGNTTLHLQDSQVFDKVLARLPDGRVLFHDNQVTYHTSQPDPVTSLGAMNAGWFKRAWDAATFSAFFFSLDEISLNGNQFQASVPLYVLQAYHDYKGKIEMLDFWAYVLKFIQVGVAGTTLRGTANGLTERLLSNMISYASIASMMNITTSNEATHVFVTNAPKKADSDNLVLTS